MPKHLGINYLEITFKDGNGLHGIRLEIVANRKAMIKNIEAALMFEINR